jgi:flagellin-specific chaperone FliS
VQAEHIQAAMPFHRRVLYALTNWGLFAAGMINLVVGTLSAIHEQVSVAATSLTAGLVLLFAGTIDRFESLKGLGIEAKTRRLDEKIEQADHAIRRLRELTELTGASLIDVYSKMGRWGSTPGAREAYALAQKVRSIMSSLGSESSVVATSLRPWATILCHDLAVSLAKPLYSVMTDKLQKLRRERDSIPIPIDPMNPLFVRLNAEIDSGQEVASRLQKIYQFELDDYPERFLRLFDNVPLLAEDEVRPIREKARKFASEMKILRESLTLPNAEAWLSELEEASKRSGLRVNG